MSDVKNAPEVIASGTMGPDFRHEGARFLEINHLIAEFDKKIRIPDIEDFLPSIKKFILKIEEQLPKIKDEVEHKRLSEFLISFGLEVDSFKEYLFGRRRLADDFNSIRKRKKAIINKLIFLKGFLPE